MTKTEKRKGSKSNISISEYTGQCGINKYASKDNTNEPKTIQAGAYIRVSTDEQAESGYSLQLQRERITAQITAKGWKLFNV